MSKVFITSDIWFNRPMHSKAEMDSHDYNDMVIKNWNETVGKSDRVYILGGVGVGDFYHLLVKLNGKIIIMDTTFTEDEDDFRSDFLRHVANSGDTSLHSKFIFQPMQIMALHKYDSMLSYFPLMEWSGMNTGTYCFHGLKSGSDLSAHRISCVMDDWDYKPVDINDVLENIEKFSKKV